MTKLRKNLVGIDLGTTYSSVSVLDEADKPHPLPNPLGNEPVAAALSFVLGSRIVGQDARFLSYLLPDEATVMVFDLGGGTFDLSLVRYDQNQLRVIAASGDEKLGEIDWDDELLRLVAEPLKKICGDMRDNAMSVRRARFELEAAKRRLSESPETVLQLKHRDNFLCFVPPDSSIANGAALFAAIIESDAPLLGSSVATRTLANYRTQNVATNGLGMILVDSGGQRIVHPLIKRQTPLPASVHVTVATTRPRQQRVSIRIVEGNVASASGHVLCKCTLEHLPPDLPENSRFDVNLTFDADGFLHVIAKHHDTGRLATVTALYVSDDS